MAEACVFCAIAKGQKQAAIVAEQPDALVFLDARPLFAGHCLVIPREHVVSFSELGPEQIGPLFALVQTVSEAVERAMGSEGTFVALNNKVSQSVPHLHVHVVPRKRKDGLKGFFWPRHAYASAEEMQAAADKIRRELLAINNRAADSSE